MIDEQVSPAVNITSAPLDEYVQDEGLWPGDKGTLDITSRRALLQLVRGPMIESRKNPELWRSLLNDRQLITSRLADLFLELVVQEEEGIAFAKNATSVDECIPKAVRTQPLTLIDTVVVLQLRRELLHGGGQRVIVGREEVYASVAQFRPLAKVDEAAFKKRFSTSWSKLVDAGILLKTTDEDRCEVSPVLRLIFGSEEVKAIESSYEELLKKS